MSLLAHCPHSSVHRSDFLLVVIEKNAVSTYNHQIASAFGCISEILMHERCFITMSIIIKPIACIGKINKLYVFVYTFYSKSHIKTPLLLIHAMHRYIYCKITSITNGYNFTVAICWETQWLHYAINRFARVYVIHRCVLVSNDMKFDMRFICLRYGF